MIVRNSIRCPICHETLISFHVHDFKMCSGHHCGVDGGNEYLRRIGSGYIELSVDDKEESFEIRRNNLHWGRNYNENMAILPKTEWILIKDLTIEHIQAILDNVLNINSLYKETMQTELIYRDFLKLSENE